MTNRTEPQTAYEKIWAAHEVVPEADEHPAVLYVDLHLVHEVTSPQAFAELRRRELSVRAPERTLATIDHSTPTAPPGADGARAFVSAAAESQVRALERHCADHGIEFLGWDSPARGIVHVIAPELGASLPGSTIVCGDSHTSTHGALGALAFGIGTSQVGHVLATQCVLQRRARTLAVDVRGELANGVGAKDLALAVTAALEFDGGTGHVLEYRGDAVRALDVEGRMTLCNMSIEAGARAGLVPVDERTIEYLRGRERCPVGEEFEAAAQGWRAFATDEGAAYDSTVAVDASTLAPMVTYGTSPDLAAPIDGELPGPHSDERRLGAMREMGLEPGSPVAGRDVDVVFIGSCTNSRLSDLREAARVLRGRTVSRDVRVVVVPGSESVKRAAEEEGLARVFLDSGAEWREPGCSMCIAMNGDVAGPGEFALSTSNRNFPGRQGRGSRTFLASPATAAASAITGCISDAREVCA